MGWQTWRARYDGLRRAAMGEGGGSHAVLERYSARRRLNAMDLSDGHCAAPWAVLRRRNRKADEMEVWPCGPIGALCDFWQADAAHPLAR